jgi:hypothetical protein
MSDSQAAIQFGISGGLELLAAINDGGHHLSEMIPVVALLSRRDGLEDQGSREPSVGSSPIADALLHGREPPLRATSGPPRRERKLVKSVLQVS